MKIWTQYVAVLPLFLAACGGGDSGSSTQPPVTTPAPAPTPTPTPVATPAPAFHNKAFDFTSASWTRQSPGVELRTFKRYEASGVPNFSIFDHHESDLHTSTGTATISYSLPTETIGFNYRNEISTFSKENINYLIETSRHYSKQVPCDPTAVNTFCGWESLDVGVHQGYDYVAVGQYTNDARRSGENNPEIRRMFLFGSPSSAEEMLPSGIFTYDAEIGTTHPDYDKLGGSAGYFGSGTLSINFSEGTIRGSISAKTGVSSMNTPYKDDTFKITGTIISKIQATGDVVNADGKLVGRFVGGFYGPNGSQFGLLFRISDAASNTTPHIIGYVVAKRK